MIKLFDPPEYPLGSSWKASIAELVKANCEVPAVALKALSLLDRFGAVHLDEDVLGLDGDDVDWSKITTVHVRSISQVLTSSALERESERVRKMIPPIPGRKWAVEKIVGVLSNLSQIALERASVPGLDRRVVSQVDYPGALRRQKSISPGFGAAAILGAIPQSNAVLLSMARDAGATILEA